jgi:4-amino-4-deoxy-L-arabinose transferase-like glycosyltransferase
VFFRGPRAHLAILIALCALSLFAALGSTPLWEPDEPRFAAATRQMVRTGDYVDPVFNARPRWEKPILLYWLQAVPLAIGLDDELAMRLPAAVLGTVAVLCLYTLGVIWCTPTAGLIAAALLATTFRFVTYARQGLTDVPAVAGIVATFLALEIGSSPERWRRARLAWWTGWVLVGLTALIKGPLAVIPPVLWIAATWIRRREALRWPAIAAGVLVAAVIGGSWFAYMTGKRGNAFVGVNNYEFLQRYFDQSFPGPSRGPFFYLAILPGEVAPWTLLIAATFFSLLRARKSLDRRTLDGVVVSIVWFVGVMLICSFSHYKLPHYALPAYPPLMLLAGIGIDRAARDEASGRIVLASAAITALIFAAAGAAAVLGALRAPDSLRVGVFSIGVVLVGGAAAAFAMLRRRQGLAPLSLTAATALAYGVAAVSILPALANAAYPYPALGRIVAEKSSPSVALGSIGAHTALVYYADRPVSFFNTPSEAAEFLRSSEPRLTVMSRIEFDAVRQHVAATELASRRRRTPRLSRLLEGTFMNAGTEELLVGNPAAVALSARGN